MGSVHPPANDIFRLSAPSLSTDHERIARNGIGYTRDMSGFSDVLARGYPPPSDPRTVLLELRSVHVPSVSWGASAAWGRGVAFVARADFVDRMTAVGFTGFEICPVEIVKVATLGRRAPRGNGEPEDQILKAKN
jgi:hypothetical protein